MEQQREDVLISELVLNDEDIIRVSKIMGATFNDIPNGEVKWKEFGMKLLLKDEDNVLSDIEKKSTGGFADCCQRLLRYWKSVKANEGEGWDRVIEALKAVGLTAPANKLENALKSLKQQNTKEIPQYKPGSSHQASEGVTPNMQYHPPAAPYYQTDPYTGNPTVKTEEPILQPPPTCISTESLGADFASLLLNICEILNSSPEQDNNLEKCKKYCLLLPVANSDGSPLFSREKIEECVDFNQLFEILKWCMNWDEHSILISIVEECKSTKARNQIKKFHKKLALLEGLQMICDTPKYDVVSKEVVRFYVVIDKLYNKLSVKEYKEIKDFIVATLGVNPPVLTKYTKILYGSLHIEWLITVQAVPFMIEMAYQKRDTFIKENFVFMQIGADIIIDKIQQSGKLSTVADAVCKFKEPTEDSQSDTSENSPSEPDEDFSESSIKSCIEKIYSKLEGLTFQGTFEGQVPMTRYRQSQATIRPVYKVKDGLANDVLAEVFHHVSALEGKIGGKKIWKGITTSGDMHELWGTEKSVINKEVDEYHIPCGGIEVIVSDTLIKYQAIVNITVE